MGHLSIQVMAHPSRAHFVEQLLADLGIGEDRVTWDRRNNRWDTGRRAWQAAARHGTEWSAVIQDDAIVCRDLVAGLEQALDSLDVPRLVSPFFGRAVKPQSGPLARLITHVGQEALTRNPSWVHGFLMHGVLLAAPTAEIGRMVAWCDRQRWPEYDKRIGKYFQRVKRQRAAYTWPSLVDHRNEASLVGHAQGRDVWRFLGEDRSALDLDWSRGSVSFPSIEQFRQGARR